MSEPIIDPVFEKLKRLLEQDSVSGFFFSRDGKILDIGYTEHTKFMNQHPDKLGFSREDLKEPSFFQRVSSKWGTVRDWDTHWVISVPDLSFRQAIKKFANHILLKYPELRKRPVEIVTPSSSQKHTFSELV